MESRPPFNNKKLLKEDDPWKGMSLSEALGSGSKRPPNQNKISN